MITLVFQRRDLTTWERRRMTIKRPLTHNGDIQFRCKEHLPFPGAWDFRALPDRWPIYYRDGDTWFVGTKRGAAGRNLSLCSVTPCTPPPEVIERAGK